MHFLLQFGDKTDSIVSAGTWALCLAYAEGTGKVIQTIVAYDETKINFIINDSDGDCYFVNLKSTLTNLPEQYIIFDSGFNEIQSWILSQQNKTLSGLSVSQKNYVTV